jgi:hypothetical protein
VTLVEVVLKRCIGDDSLQRLECLALYLASPELCLAGRELVEEERDRVDEAKEARGFLRCQSLATMLPSEAERGKPYIK